MKTKEFCNSFLGVEKCIRNTIKNEHLVDFPRYWNEDQITATLLKKLRKESHKFVFNNSHKVEFDVLKATGTLENTNGDIGFLVEITFSNNNSLQGVAFLEAKRTYPDKYDSYDAIKWDQLSRISKSANHRMVFYDNKPSYPLSNCLVDCPNYVFCILRNSDYLNDGTYVYTALTHHAITLKSKKREDLHEISIPFSYQIFSRYFQGLDLDFSPELVDGVKNFAQTKSDGVKFLVVANVVIGGDSEPSVDDRVNELSISYQRITDSD